MEQNVEIIIVKEIRGTRRKPTPVLFCPQNVARGTTEIMLMQTVLRCGLFNKHILHLSQPFNS
jgi:hypothetical protein